ncbi:MAG: hypothetical protein QXI60_11820 [Thermofilaceae archaeon]
MALKSYNELEGDVESWELEIVTHIICFWSFRRISLLVLIGLLPIMFDTDVSFLHRWIASGFAVATLLCWYLPLLGCSVVLAEEEPLHTRRKRLFVTRTIIILSYLFPFTLAICGEKWGLVDAFSLLDSKGSIPLLPLIGVSGSLSAYYLYRRIFYYRDKALELIDYRYIISYSLWTIFALSITFISILGRSH